MKQTVTEVADIDTGEVDTVPAPEVAPRKRGRPVGSTRPKPKADTPSGRPTNNSKLVRSLEQNYIMLGTLLMVLSPVTGMAVIEGAEQCAESLGAWALVNPKVQKALERGMTGAGAFTVLAAHAPIALAAYSDFMSRTKSAPANAGANDFTNLEQWFTAPTESANAET